MLVELLALAQNTGLAKLHWHDDDDDDDDDTDDDDDDDDDNVFFKGLNAPTRLPPMRNFTMNRPHTVHSHSRPGLLRGKDVLLRTINETKMLNKPF